MKVPTSHGQRRETSPLAAIDLCPHQPERYGYAVHRSPGDRRVALQDAEAIDRRDEAGQKTDPGTGVANVN